MNSTWWWPLRIQRTGQHGLDTIATFMQSVAAVARRSR